MAFALALVACACAPQLPATSARACTQEQLAVIITNCDQQMHARCAYEADRPDPNCPAVTECKAALEDWKVCK